MMTDENKNNAENHAGPVKNNIADFPDEMARLKRLEQKKLAEMEARAAAKSGLKSPGLLPEWRQGGKAGAHPTAGKPVHEPILNIPPFTLAICSGLFIIHLVLYLLPPELAHSVFRHLAFIPALYLEPALAPAQLFYAPFSHMLLHGGWFHIGINVAMLLAFGSAVEKFIGGRRLVALLLIGGALGAFSHMALYWGSLAILVGASGGISGLFGALIRSLQAQGQMKPGWRGLLPITLLWVGISVLFALFSSVPGGDANIAWGAHFGGFLGGLLFYGPVMRLIR